MEELAKAARGQWDGVDVLSRDRIPISEVPVVQVQGELDYGGSES